MISVQVKIRPSPSNFITIEGLNPVGERLRLVTLGCLCCDMLKKEWPATWSALGKFEVSGERISNFSANQRHF